MGSGSFSQVHIQLVLAVKGRQSLIHKSWEENLYRYIHGIIEGMGHRCLAINGMPDHLHIFFGYKLNNNIPDMIREIKKSTSRWIKENRFVNGSFYWQEGYGAFSYSNWDVQKIIQYVRNQKEHHRKTTFEHEYKTLLNEFEIPYQ